MNASYASIASKLALLALPVFGLLALSGCKPYYPECKKDKHCKVDEGEKCVEGMCQNCTTDDECQGKGPNGENFVCFEFRCTDPAEAGVTGGGGELGAPCTESMECNGYTCNLSQGYEIHFLDSQCFAPGHPSVFCPEDQTDDENNIEKTGFKYDSKDHGQQYRWE